MNKEMKYYYYISKSKIDMLFGQFPSGTLSSKIGSKLSAPGIEVTAELKSQNQKNLLEKTASVIKYLEKSKKIINLRDNENHETGEYYHNHGLWHSGIMGAGDSELSFSSYFLWKINGNTLIILVGSPTNILGNMNVKYNVDRFVPTTDSIVGQMMNFTNFIQKNIGTSEIPFALHISKHLLSLKLDKKDEHILNNVLYPVGASRIEHLPPFEDSIHFPDILYRAPSRAMAMGLFCLYTMKDLPNIELELVFKKYYLMDMKLPEDLSIWIYQLKELSSEGENVEEFDHVRRVLLGTPLYTVIR